MLFAGLFELPATAEMSQLFAKLLLLRDWCAPCAESSAGRFGIHCKVDGCFRIIAPAAILFCRFLIIAFMNAFQRTFGFAFFFAIRSNHFREKCYWSPPFVFSLGGVPEGIRYPTAALALLSGRHFCRLSFVVSPWQRVSPSMSSSEMITIEITGRPMGWVSNGLVFLSARANSH